MPSATPRPAVAARAGKRPEAPCIFTSVAPAWNNANLRRLAEKIVSPLIFAHIRAASPGSPTNETNCHPFQCGRFMWMHNGCIADFGKVKKRIINHLDDRLFDRILGTTDSEYCFLLFLQVLFEDAERLRQDSPAPSPSPSPSQGLPQPASAGGSSPLLSPQTGRKGGDVPEFGAYGAEQLAGAMLRTIALLNSFARACKVPSASLMNFAVTDGESVVSPPPSSSLFFFFYFLFWSSLGVWRRPHGWRWLYVLCSVSPL
jgi:glutamine amidotransferase